MVVNIPSATLKQLVKLTERKEALMAQIQDIDREILALERQFEEASGLPGQKGPVTFSTVRKQKVTRRRSR